jgi:hypothetical protein
MKLLTVNAGADDKLVNERFEPGFCEFMRFWNQPDLKSLQVAQAGALLDELDQLLQIFNFKKI